MRILLMLIFEELALFTYSCRLITVVSFAF